MLESLSIIDCVFVVNDPSAIPAIKIVNQIFILKVKNIKTTQGYNKKIKKKNKK